MHHTKAPDRPARIVMVVRVLDLTDAEARALRERLFGCEGVLYADIDGPSGFVEVEYQTPCAPEQVLSVLRATGKPVLSEPACC